MRRHDLGARPPRRQRRPARRRPTAPRPWLPAEFPDGWARASKVPAGAVGCAQARAARPSAPAWAGAQRAPRRRRRRGQRLEPEPVSYNSEWACRQLSGGATRPAIAPRAGSVRRRAGRKRGSLMRGGGCAGVRRGQCGRPRDGRGCGRGGQCGRGGGLSGPRLRRSPGGGINWRRFGAEGGLCQVSNASLC